MRRQAGCPESRTCRRRCHGLDVDAGDAHQMGAAGGVEVIQIGDVLEVVGVLITVLHGGIGHHIVAVLVDLQVDALLGQNGYALLQDLGVGGWERRLRSE